MPDIALPAGGTDWGAALDSAAQAKGAPLANNPEAFSSYYGPIADKVSAKTGIDSNTILGQWGLETGWGKSVIPGTNNLGNIKSTDGSGVSATDNQTGSNDKYQKFDTPDAFADHYANLLNSKYPGAIGTGADAAATAAGLVKGGYATDPQYASKVTSAAQRVAALRGGTNWDALLGGAGQAAQPSATPVASHQIPGITSMDQFNQTIPKNAPQTDGSGNPISSFAGGLGEGFGKTVLGAEALVGKGAQAIGADTIGNALVNDAQTGNKNLTAEGDALGGTGFARTAGNIVGAVAPALAVGPEVLPQAALGGAYGASNAALTNQDILPAAVEGAGLGALGSVGGQLAGAGLKAAAPIIAKAKGAITGGTDAAAAKIAGQLGDGLSDTIDNLNANSNEIIPGSLPTAAEAANNPAIVRIQRQLNNTEAGQEAFPARQAANTAARLDAGQAVVGSNIDAEAQAFTAQQAQRVAQGQTELAPLSDSQAATMQTPAYAQAIKQARSAAADVIPDFENQSGALNRGIANDVEAVSGTPEQLQAAKDARAAEAATNYGAIDGEVPLTPDLTSRPGVLNAIAKAAKNDDTRLGEAAPDGFSTTKPKVAPVLDEAGANVGFKTVQPAQTVASLKTLQGAKAILADDAGSAAQANRANEANVAGNASKAIHNFLLDNSPEYAQANAAFAQASTPIDQMAALQKRLVSAVDPNTGQVSPGALKRTIDSIQAEQLKPGIRPADKITDNQMQALINLRQRAIDAPTTLTGLQGQGQEFLRQALEQNAAKTTGQLTADSAERARQSFQNYLEQSSPSYKKFFDAQAGYGQDLASRQNLAQALSDLASKAQNGSGLPNVTLAGAKASLNKAGPLTGAARDYADNLLEDLQRGTNANASLGAAGSQTLANAQLGGGLLGKLLGHGIGEASIVGSAINGHIVPALLGAIGKKAFGAASAKTEKAAIELLLNPKQLAAELAKFKNQPEAKKVFVDTLKQKATGAGKAGAKAVQVYNAAQSAN